MVSFKGIYNKRKWGLDKSTELREFLKPKTPMPFEPKYLYVILACILVNLWRVEQAITIAKPFILQYRSNNDGQNASIFQLRRALNELPFQDFVRQFTFHCLQELQLMARQTVLTSFFSPARRLRMRALADGGNEADDEENGAEDLFVSETLDRLSDANRWPIRRNRVKTFSERDDLHRVRKHFSSRHTHSSVPVEKMLITKKAGKPVACVGER